MRREGELDPARIAPVPSLCTPRGGVLILKAVSDAGDAGGGVPGRRGAMSPTRQIPSNTHIITIYITPPFY